MVKTTEVRVRQETRRDKVMYPTASHSNALCRKLVGSLPPYRHPNVEDVLLTRGQTLFENKSRIDHLYFPTSAVVTRTYLATCGHTAEMGMVGHEGVVGISLLLGAETANNEALVHVDGRALRMERTAAVNAFQRCEPFRHAVLRYARAMITQISQLAVCNSLHCIEQRFCRWFLMTLDRADTAELMLSHHFVAQMLAVRRESISCALAHLAREGLVLNEHRRIRLLDRAAMEALSCECYHVIREEYAPLFDRQIPNSKCTAHAPE